MKPHLITAQIIARELLCYLKGGAVGVVMLYDGKLDATQVVVLGGRGRMFEYFIDQTEFSKSLNDFEPHIAQMARDLEGWADFTEPADVFKAKWAGCDDFQVAILRP